jgi:DNA (cytosine-5)-methyltransferase 1
MVVSTTDCDCEMRLLDLFCGAGGAGMGYHRAGFDVVGVDCRPQKHYPFQFHQADAFEYLEAHGHEFDVIHASPPCQAFTDLKRMYNAKQHPDLLTPMREVLRLTGKPYVIENVEGAPMQNYFTLCGSMFTLGTQDAELRRHRRFEANWLALMIPQCQHGRRARVIGVYGGHGRDRRRTVNTQDFSVEDRRTAMGIDWMTGAELSQAIPPAYTEWIGMQLVNLLTAKQPCPE